MQPIRVKRHELTTRGLLERIHKPGLATLLDAVQDSSPDTRTALDERARDLGSLVAKLSTEHAPSTVVIAGSAFIDDPHAPAPFARTVRAEMEQAPELRMIPTHAEVVRDIARAAALDLVLREPLTVAAS